MTDWGVGSGQAFLGKTKTHSGRLVEAENPAHELSTIVDYSEICSPTRAKSLANERIETPCSGVVNPK